MNMVSKGLGSRTRWVLALVLCIVVLSVSAATPSRTSPHVLAQQSDRFETEKEFARHLLEIETLLDKITDKVGRGVTVAAESRGLLKEKESLLALDPAIHQRFDEREQELISNGLPDVILDRHHTMVDNYEQHFQILIDNLTQIESLSHQGRTVEFFDRVQATREHLKQHKTKDAPRFLSADGLPVQSIKKKAPVLDISAAKPPAGAQAGVAASVPTSPPVAEDLDPTIDVQITQEIIDLAASLDNSPLKIYQHVKDNFQFEPYLGSRKGSRETLLVGSGNDYDLASLLIALLRASNTPSRYIAGTVYMPIDQAMNWLGVQDPATAADLLATAGMEGTSYTDGGGQIVAVTFKHVWVAAHVPYTNYRGIPNDTTGEMWVPLDPSFKSDEYQPAVDIPAEMGFDAEAFLDDYISTFHELSPVELYLQQIEDYVTTNRPDLTYPDDVFRRRTIVPEGLGLLPASRPFVVLSKDAEYAEIPANKRHQIRFHITDDWGSTLLDHTANLPEIASKRVTISYVAATPADQATIDAYGDLYLTPPYLIYLKPVLKVGGVTVAEGGSIGAGTLHYSDMYFLAPDGESNPVPVVHNYITAGTYQGAGIDTFRVGMGIFIPTEDGTVPDTDDLTGEKLYRTAMSYLDRVDRVDQLVDQTMQMVHTTSVSEAIVENVILVWYFFGMPWDWEWRGLIIDADRKIVGPFSVVGDTNDEKQFMILTGVDASISENRIFEDTYDEEAISAVKILELASDQGIPIYDIDSSNIGTILPLLNVSSSVKNYITDAVNNGRVVTIARDEIVVGQWQGTGFIVMDPVTGAAGYIIAGGQNGGATVDIWISLWMYVFTMFRDLCDTNPITADITAPAPNSYWPVQSWWDWFNLKPVFKVTYHICYEGGGTRDVNETYRPHWPYPAGDYTFYAGWGTGATVDFTMFDVEFESPADDCACKDGDSITLHATVNPRVPPGATYNWRKTGTGDGNGIFSEPNAQTTEFYGTTLGELEVKVEVSNANGPVESNSERLTVCSVIPSCGSEPTTEQRSRLEGWFPGLKWCEWRITGGATRMYNCIAWTVDDTTHRYTDLNSVPGTNWIGIDEVYGDNDGVFELIDDLDVFYNALKGYTPTASGVGDAKVMYYSNYHGAKRSNCTDNCGAGAILFESKCGEAERLVHVHDQLNGTSYGTPIRYYK